MARGDDDLEPRHRRVPPKPLDPLSVEELGEYIAELRAEIARAEAEIKAKQAHSAAAALFFKKK
ncbi:MAG: DUF1192 domain-containing protein [Rhodospirillales bacterium]|nr:MAG: DUF1192 domain-containing protein [Rhodospirillales bacterium]